jgi:hypothetical protein
MVSSKEVVQATELPDKNPAQIACEDLKTSSTFSVPESNPHLASVIAVYRCHWFHITESKKCDRGI